MVNEEFKRELNQLLRQSLLDSLPQNGGQWELHELSSNEEIEKPEFFVLTISSQLFRILVLFYFEKDETSENYVADSLGINLSNLESDKYYDFLGEVGNAFCGTIKRDLCRTVPSLGMSTPNRLVKDCLKYMTTVNDEYQTHVRMSQDNGPVFYASLYLYADEDLSFEVNKFARDEEDVDNGELEFF